MELILATSNLHKILELKAMLRPHLKGVDLISLRDFPDFQLPDETGATFKENAEQKALYAAKGLNKFAIADDSGLVVPALNGEPGIRSRRYAGDEASDIDNRNKLIEALKVLREEERAAYYECALSLAPPDGIIKTVSGFCEGTLILEPRGRSGFGYDSMFIKYDYSKTLAELDEDTKNRISHRRKALDKLSITLEESFLCTT